MRTVNLCEAKTTLSKLVDKAASGQDIIIARDAKPVARLTQLAPTKAKIRLGMLKGKVRVASDFDALLPDSVLKGFE